MYTNVPLTSIIKIASAWYLLRGEKSNRKTSAFLLHKLDVLTRGWSCCIFNYLVFILYIFISFHFDQFDPAKQREVWCCRRYDAECELQSVSFFDHFLGSTFSLHLTVPIQTAPSIRTWCWMEVGCLHKGMPKQATTAEEAKNPYLHDWEALFWGCKKNGEFSTFQKYVFPFQNVPNPPSHIQYFPPQVLLLVPCRLCRQLSDVSPDQPTTILPPSSSAAAAELVPFSSWLPGPLLPIGQVLPGVPGSTLQHRASGQWFSHFPPGHPGHPVDLVQILQHPAVSPPRPPPTPPPARAAHRAAQRQCPGGVGRAAAASRAAGGGDPHSHCIPNLQCHRGKQENMKWWHHDDIMMKYPWDCVVRGGCAFIVIIIIIDPR